MWIKFINKDQRSEIIDDIDEVRFFDEEVAVHQKESTKSKGFSIVIPIKNVFKIVK